MSRRIGFIAPVEYIAGNLSGTRELEYPTNDNAAYDSPMGSVNYARNYVTRYIGVRRASDGKTFFQVKTKTATHVTTRSKKSMALLGGAGAMFASLMRIKTSAVYAGILAQFIELQQLGLKDSFREYVMGNFRSMLVNKAEYVVFSGPQSPVTVNNPWVASAMTPGANVSNDILKKFWSELAIDGISFTIAGLQGIGKAGETFAEIITSDHNVLNLTTEEISGTEYVKISYAFVLDEGGDYVTSGEQIAPGVAYGVTDIQPE